MVLTDIAHKQSDETGPVADNDDAIGDSLGWLVLTETAGEEVAPIDRRQVPEDVKPIIDEVGYTQLVAHRVLLGPLAHEVHVGRVNALRPNSTTGPKPAASQFRDLRARLGDDVDAVLEQRHQLRDGLERSGHGRGVHRLSTEEGGVRTFSDPIHQHTTDIETKHGRPFGRAPPHRAAAKAPLLRRPSHDSQVYATVLHRDHRLSERSHSGWWTDHGPAVAAKVGREPFDNLVAVAAIERHVAFVEGLEISSGCHGLFGWPLD